MTKLAILIPTTPDRQPLLDRLVSELNRQIGDRTEDVKILINEDIGYNNGGKSHGVKRNECVSMALAEKAYAIAFHDSDDLPGPTYIQRGLEFVESGMDCAELWGQIYFSGRKGNPFHHYIDCVNPATGKIEWWQDAQFYYRMINHLNFKRLDLVKDIPFLDQGFGEDGKQSEAMRDAGVFKTMYPIPEIIYHYFTGEPKHAI